MNLIDLTYYFSYSKVYATGITNFFKPNEYPMKYTTICFLLKWRDEMGKSGFHYIYYQII